MEIINEIPLRIFSYFIFVGYMYLGIFDRFPIYILYRYLNIKIHSKIVTILVQVISLLLGVTSLIIGLIGTYLKSSLAAFTLTMLASIAFIAFGRWFNINEKYLYLDDEFYKNHSGNDIREQKIGNQE